MAYTPPGITINQAPPQQQTTASISTTRVIAALFNAPIGPDMPTLIDPSQGALVYGDPSNPANSGFSGPRLLQEIASQVASARASSVKVLGLRAGVTRASVAITGATGTAQVTTINEYTVAAGTFTVTYGGFTTAALAYNVSTAALQSALQGLASIGSGNVTVTGTAGTQYICTFGGTMANQPLPNFVIATSGIGSGAITSTVTTPGVIGTGFTLTAIGAYAGSRGNYLRATVNAPQVAVTESVKGNTAAAEVQTLVIYQMGGSPSGSLTLSWGGSNASAVTAANILSGGAANLQTALQSISGLSGNVTVTQSGGIGTPQVGALTFVITFSGTLATGAQAIVGVNTNTITGGTGVLPVQSVVITDTYGGGSVVRQQISAGQYNLTTCGNVFSAINQQNPTSQPTSVIQATTLSGAAGSLAAQALTAFTGGVDGLGITPGTGDVVSPDGSTKTIPYLLAAALNPALGPVEFLTAGFDAGAVMGSIQTHIASALGVNSWRKFYGGPVAGTTYASLISTYQTANSDRVVLVGHDAMTGSNPTNGSLSAAVDGFLVAAAVCAQKALQAPQENLYGQALNGLSSVTPTPPDFTTPITYTQLNALAGAGYTVLQYSPQSGRMGIRDLISTAAQTDAYGNPNRFMYASERDAFDRIAMAVYAGLLPLVGSAAQAPTQIQQTFQSAAMQIMATCQGLGWHNGAVASATYDPVALVVTVNIGYLDRPPLNNIVVNLAPLATLPTAA